MIEEQASLLRTAYSGQLHLGMSSSVVRWSGITTPYNGLRNAAECVHATVVSRHAMLIWQLRSCRAHRVLRTRGGAWCLEAWMTRGSTGVDPSVVLQEQLLVILVAQRFRFITIRYVCILH